MTPRHRLRMIPVALLAAALSLTACGGKSDAGAIATLNDGTATATPRASASGDLEKQLADYVECLRKQGVDIPDPTVDAKGQVSFGRPAAGARFDRGALTKAREACGDLPAGLTTGPGTMDRSQMQDTLLTFARCMREQGIDMPDPDMSKVGTGEGSPFGDLDRDDPKVAAATEVCQKAFTDSRNGASGGRS